MVLWAYGSRGSRAHPAPSLGGVAFHKQSPSFVAAVDDCGSRGEARQHPQAPPGGRRSRTVAGQRPWPGSRIQRLHRNKLSCTIKSFWLNRDIIMSASAHPQNAIKRLCQVFGCSPAKLKRTASLVLAMLPIGCATPYQPSGFTGGYKETQLAPDIVRVYVNGNGYTGRERVQDFALLRAAELALNSGYPYFVVLSESNEKSTGSFTTAGSSHTSGSLYGVGNNSYYSGTTTFIPGQTVTFEYPKTGMIVKFLKKKSNDGLVFDADFLSRNVKAKYKIKI